MKTVIFDLDGTLADSEQAHYEAEKRVLQKTGVELSFGQYLKHFAGRTDEEALAGFLGSRKNAKKTASFRELAREKNRVFIKLVPRFAKPYKQTVGAAKMLRRTGVKLGLATSAVGVEASALLRCLGLKKFFSAVVSGDKVRRGKPAPDLYLLAAKKLGASPEDCVVVEDSVAGVSSAKKAGMKCVAVTHTFPKKLLSNADDVVNDLAPGGSKKLFKAVVEEF